MDRNAKSKGAPSGASTVRHVTLTPWRMLVTQCNELRAPMRGPAAVRVMAFVCPMSKPFFKVLCGNTSKGPSRRQPVSAATWHSRVRVSPGCTKLCHGMLLAAQLGTVRRSGVMLPAGSGFGLAMLREGVTGAERNKAPREAADGDTPRAKFADAPNVESS